MIPVTVAAAVADAAGAAAGGPATGVAISDRALEDLRRAWSALSRSGARPLIVRSSSTVEDTEQSSMAGRFDSLLDVRGWPDFLDAVRRVVHSAEEALGPEARQTMAVLVQPMVSPAWGGVLFGADPVTGDPNRLVIAAVPDGPDRLVRGAVDGLHLTIDRKGKLLEHDEPLDPVFDRDLRRRLADLAGKVAEVYGSPQDVEWALTKSGELLLLQSRPITTLEQQEEVQGPVFGPGPVAETFPSALAPLEQDLWVDPLRDAIRHVLGLLGLASSKQLQASPVVCVVDGYVAIDLDLLEGRSQQSVARRLFDPRPRLRKLRTAWLVGRLAVALPAIARRVIAATDRRLADVPDPSTLSGSELLGVLERTRQALVAVYGYEQLAGQLISRHDEGTTAVAEALRVLASGRADALSDEELRFRSPITLVLTPPAIGPLPPLPRLDRTPPPVREHGPDALLREALRVRTRWLQELSARVALEIGHRLVEREVLARPEDVRWLRLGELPGVMSCRQDCRLDDQIEMRRQQLDGTPLPARFRLDAQGRPVAVYDPAARSGRGAGGGRGVGRVYKGVDPPAGSVLVVRNLDPSLAASLPKLSGLVAETGSVLSHLAILARELGIPTVVGMQGALDRLPDGARVSVDGQVGTVEVLDAEEAGR